MRVHHPGCGGHIDLTQGPGRTAILDLQHYIFRRGGTQGKCSCGVGICHPEIFVLGEMRLLACNQEIQVFLHCCSRQGTEALVFLERQLEHGTAQVIEQYDQVIGVDQGMLGRASEEVIRMVSQELVERAGGCHQDCHGRLIASACPPGLLPGTCNRPRISNQQRRAQATNVNPQFECIGSHDGANCSIPQPFFDGTPLGRQVTGAVTANFLTPGPSPGRRGEIRRGYFLQILEQDLHTPA